MSAWAIDPNPEYETHNYCKTITEMTPYHKGFIFPLHPRILTQSPLSFPNTHSLPSHKPNQYYRLLQSVLPGMKSIRAPCWRMGCCHFIMSEAVHSFSLLQEKPRTPPPPQHTHACILVCKITLEIEAVTIKAI